MKTSKTICIITPLRASCATKRLVWLTICSVCAIAFSVLGITKAEAQQLVDFTFEQFTSGTGQNTGPYNAEVNNTGATAQVTLTPGGTGTTTVSSPVGNGSLHSYSSTNFATGGYFQFTVSTANQTAPTLSVSYDQAGSASGPRDFALYYSTTGTTGTFTQLAGSSYQIASGSFSSATASAAFTHTFDLSGVPDLNNNANDVFRIEVIDAIAISGAALSTGGTDRIDNFTVTGVPEPATVLSGVLLVGALGWNQRRRLGGLAGLLLNARAA